MKAGIYDPYLDTLGGGERYCLTIAEILSEMGWDVDIFWSGDKELISKAVTRFSLNLNKAKFVDDIFNIRPHSIELLEENDTLYHSRPLASSKNPLNSLKQFINKYQITKKYDLIFFLSDGSIPFVFSKNNILHIQVPFVFNLDLKTKLLNSLKLKLFKNIVCNSQFTKRFTDRNLNHTSTVLYPPIDIQKITPDPHKHNVILSAGRFDSILNAKRHDVLIEAFRLLCRQNQKLDWKLILTGGSKEDPEKNQYLKHLHYLAQDLNIQIDPNPPFTRLQHYYSIAKIYWHAAGYGVEENLHPESTEHFGMMPVEAMSGGAVPVLVAKGGLPEIVTDGKNGYLWSTKEELVAKTQLLIASPELLTSLSKQAIIDIQVYSKEEFKKKLIALI